MLPVYKILQASCRYGIVDVHLLIAVYMQTQHSVKFVLVVPKWVEIVKFVLTRT